MNGVQLDMIDAVCKTFSNHQPCSAREEFESAKG
jgi:hypothetical protein